MKEESYSWATKKGANLGPENAKHETVYAVVVTNITDAYQTGQIVKRRGGMSRWSTRREKVWSTLVNLDRAVHAVVSHIRVKMIKECRHTCRHAAQMHTRPRSPRSR